MNVPKRLVELSRKQPARALVGIVAFLTVMGALLITTPWATPLTGGPLAGLDWPLYVSVGLNIACATPAMLAVFKNTSRSLSRGAFWLFVWFLYVVLIRIIMTGVSSLYWLTPLIVALMMAVVYVEQAAVANQSDHQAEGGVDVE